jgi:phosphatidylinositol-3,4,5-trisphosphate 3-phosphatase/dual-specificity protein phosphatase PTEN
LCLEKNRIYDKNRFPNYPLAIFPFTDHDPCPIKLMLEFCVDICLYFLKNPHSVAAIHCKAGKGRTGIMIICYLFFSGLCKNSDEAIEHFAKMRTKNRKVNMTI